MKSTGIVRRVDRLGRLVLPMELRTTLDIQENDSLEIFVEDSSIILKKYSPACMFCNHTEDVLVHNGKNICKRCIEELSSRAGVAEGEQTA